MSLFSETVHAPTHEVAKLIHRHLRRRKQRSPGIAQLEQLVKTLFFASLKTEESREVTCTVALVDVRDPAGEDPPQIRPHRRSYVPLETPIVLGTRTLTQFSQAAPPWASCIAVYAKDQRFYICGFFDQEIQYRTALNQEGGSWFARPGLFQIEVTGVGSLTVFDDRTLITTLNQDAVIGTFRDVVNEGPIAKILAKYIVTLEKKIRKRLSGLIPKVYIDIYFGESAADVWLQMLSRILLGIKRQKHGGALLIIPVLKSADLKIKYKLAYDKTELVIAKHITNAILENAAWFEIENYLEMEAENIPAVYYLDETVANNERKDAVQAEVGCANFIASLAGVDGLILMAGGVKVRGFAVEITRRRDPDKVYAARGARIGKGNLRQIDFARFGTRHRSMMRYCYHHPRSIGFVISQDGDIRAMTRVPRGLILWENIRLQEVNIGK
jgi:hypothetical protein